MVEESESVEGVLVLLREQAALYRRLAGYATRQRSLVTGDDTAPLLAVLADRRKVSDALLQVGRRLAPVRQRWPSVRARLSPSEQSEADRLLTEASSRLEQVMKDDEHDVRVLSGRKQAVAAALGKTQSTSRAITAYREPIGRSARVRRVDEES